MQGQQVILTTHNYVLLKRLDLLDQKNEGTLVRYHTLSRNPESGEVEVNSTDDYQDIPNNPIDDAFASIIDEELLNELGEL